VSSFLTPHKHILGYLVPYDGEFLSDWGEGQSIKAKAKTTDQWPLSSLCNDSNV